MANFAEPVSIFMSTPVHTISQDAPLKEAEENMRKLGITSLAAVDAEGRCTGVITTTDLIRSGRRNAGNRQDASLLETSGTVANIMTPDVVSVDIETSMQDAAKVMLDKGLHRVFVMAKGDIAGVVSTRDIMAAVEATRVNKPVTQFMSSPVFTIRATETIALATERLEKARVTGLIVVDDSGWPVGIFGQEEALDSGEMERSAQVEQAMSAAVLTLPDHSVIHNVARQALAMDARRIAVMNRHEVVGIMTGVDFARAIC